MRRSLTAVLALTLVLGLPAVTSPPTARAASVCTGWSSLRVPPATIRVLRSATNTVQVVDFKSYVQVVMAAEWPSTWNAEALKVGAMAVKQFGWYYTMHWRGGTKGSCYDVVDGTSDQLYQPESRTVSAATKAAIDATWTETATKSGAFMLMGYRSGSTVACGADADGYHLYQHSSKACADNGMLADQILHVYFDPGLAIWTPAPRPSLVFLSPPVATQATAAASATISWDEEPAAGATIASRLVTLTMALPRNGSCSVDRWVTVSPGGWRSTGPSPQTVTGLRTGFCYRAVVILTDSLGATTRWLSGTVLVDPAAPRATFTSPPPNAATAITGTTATVSWTETPAAGTHVVSRSLVTEQAPQPGAGTCAGAIWGTRTTVSSASPYSSTGLARLTCYRYRLVLTDSAGHKSTTVSGVLVGPTA
jgi:hypothetical protein